MNVKVKICCDFCLFFLFFFSPFSSLYQLLCLVCLLQVPGIPLATGKQQDCLLYPVTIATGLECEAITVALCWAEARRWQGWITRVWLPGQAMAHRVRALCPLHLWLFSFSLEHGFTENVVFF